MAQSLLIVGQNRAQVKTEAAKIAAQNSSAVDITEFDARENRGINEVKELLASSFRRPFNSKLLTIIILQADNLTNEAQNSLLKLLEEPPDETQIILTTQNRGSLLPTVVSRCLEITVSPENRESAAKQLSAEEFDSKKFSEKLDFFEKKPLEVYLGLLQEKLEARILSVQPQGQLSVKEISAKARLALKLTKAAKSSANNKLLALLLALDQT